MPGSLDDEKRLRLLDRTLRDDSTVRSVFDLVARAVGASLDVPVAIVSVVTVARQEFLGQTGMPARAATGTPISHSFCQHVITDASPLVINSSVDDPRVSDNPSVQELGVAAYAGQPIVVHGQVLGSMCAIDHTPRVWSEQELATLRAFADLCEYLISVRLASQGELLDQRAAAAARDQRQTAEIAEFRALAEEQKLVDALSRELQQGLLPQPTAPDHLDVDLYYSPGTERLLLGGDFADTMIANGRQLNFVLGDVAGHGPRAAALAISLRATWNALQAVGIPPERIMTELDVQTAAAGLNATVLLGRVTPDLRLQFLSAGHPSPVFAALGAARELPGGVGPMLGLKLDAPRWEVSEHSMLGGEIVAYTDGLIEGLVGRSRERYGMERLLGSIVRVGSDPELLCAEATRENGAPLPDDVAILRIRAA